MLERIHANSENTLVLYQKSLDENLSRTETYLYVFALNDADLLSLRAAEPQTTSWYVTLNGKYYLVRILNLNGYLLGAYISTDTLLGTLVDTKTQDSLLYFSDGSLLLRTPSSDVRLEAPRLKWRRYPSYDIDETSWMVVSHELKETPLSLTLLLKDSEYTKYQSSFYLLALIVSLGLFVIWLLLSASLHRWVLHPVHTHADACAGTAPRRRSQGADPG